VEVKRCAKSSVTISIAERPPQRSEGWLSRAVTGRDVFHFEVIAEGCDDLFDVRITRHDEMESAGNDPYARVDAGRRGNNLVDARM
jgi:hypothetical protein